MSYAVRTYNKRTGKIHRTWMSGFGPRKEAETVLDFFKATAPKKVLKLRRGRVIKIR